MDSNNGSVYVITRRLGYDGEEVLDICANAELAYHYIDEYLKCREPNGRREQCHWTFRQSEDDIEWKRRGETVAAIRYKIIKERVDASAFGSVATHPPTAECPDAECLACGERDCPEGEPLHYHHDGCPVCWRDDEKQ